MADYFVKIIMQYMALFSPLNERIIKIVVYTTLNRPMTGR